MNTRFLGIMFALGALVVGINGLRNNDLDILTSVCYVIWGLGGICGMIAMNRLNALGSNAIARAVGFLPVIGFLAFVLGDGLRVLGLINIGQPLYNLLGSIGWIGMLSGMLIVSILTIAAKTWRGWRRFAPLLTIVMIPVAFGIGAAVGALQIAQVIAFVPWLVLGYVIATTEPAPAVQQSVIA
jgi:hypothetical protein